MYSSVVLMWNKPLPLSLPLSHTHTHTSLFFFYRNLTSNHSDKWYQFIIQINATYFQNVHTRVVYLLIKMINLHVFGVSAPATLYNILGERALLNQANLFRFVECANINFRRFLTIVRELCQDNFYVIRFAYRVDRPMLHLVLYSVSVRCCVST